MIDLKKARRLGAALAALLLGVVPSFADAQAPDAPQRAPLGTAQTWCTVEGCTHTEEGCPALVTPTFSYNGADAPRGTDYYYSQLRNELTQKALDAIDAYWNPTGNDIPTPRLGVIEVHSLPARLTEADLTAIHQQVVDMLCIARPQYYWLDKNNLRFALKSGTQSSVLVMDFSDRILNVYESMTQAAEEGKAADAAAKEILARLEGVTGDVARLRVLHNAVLAASDFTYEIEQAYSFTGVLVHGRALCEGYAKAFQLLARRAGYECELVVGYGIRPDGSEELHMWNAVKMGDGWYLVDCTWDDSAKLSGGDQYRYFLLNAAKAKQLGTHVENGNINLKTLKDGVTPSPEVKVFRFPALAGAAKK